MARSLVVLIIDENIESFFVISEWLYHIIERPIIFECRLQEQVAELMMDCYFDIVICKTNFLDKNKHNFMRMKQGAKTPFFILHGDKCASEYGEVLIENLDALRLEKFNYSSLKESILGIKNTIEIFKGDVPHKF